MHFRVNRLVIIQKVNYPSFIQLYPTLRCNQYCNFCFNQSILGSNLYKDMNVKDAYKLSGMLLKAGVFEIDVLGGEPMLIPWMKDFVGHVIDSGMTLNISTNGSLPDAMNRLLEIQAGSPDIGFSIHGLSKTHNDVTKSENFFHAITGIKTLIDRGKIPIVKSLLLPENKNEIYNLVSYLSEIGVKRYYLLHEDIIGRKNYSTYFSFPEFWNFYSKLKIDMEGILDIGFVAASGFYPHGPQTKGRCNAGITKIAVMPDGSAFPCNLFAGFKEFRLGNILEDGIEKVWRSPVLEAFRRYDGINRCKRNDCNHYSTCRGGCPAHSYYFYGSVDIMDPRCKIKP